MPQAVEEEGAHRQLRPHALDVELAAEAPHRDLEGMRPAPASNAIASPSRISSPAGRAAHQLHDLRDRRADLVQAAGIDAHGVARLVHLDARAVHLPLERRLAAELPQRIGRDRPRFAPASARWARESRAGTLAGRRFLAQARLAPRRRCRRAYIIARRTSPPALPPQRDRIDHHARERALAKLAEQQPDQEPSFG